MILTTHIHLFPVIKVNSWNIENLSISIYLPWSVGETVQNLNQIITLYTDVSLYISIYIYLSNYPSLSLSLWLSFYLSISLTILLSLWLSFHLSISIYQNVLERQCQNLNQKISFFMDVSLYLSIYLSLLSILLFIANYLSIRMY